MKRHMGCATLMLLAGCNQLSTTGSNSTAPANTVDLLKEGNGAACSQQDTRDLLISEVKPTDKDHGAYDLGDFQSFLSDVSYSIDTISLASIDKSIASVTCEDNLIIHYKDHGDKTFSVRYELRTSVENASTFIIHTDTTDAHAYAVSGAQEAASSDALAKQQAQQQADTKAQEQLQAAQAHQASAAAAGEAQQSNQQDSAPTSILPPGSNYQQ